MADWVTTLSALLVAMLTYQVTPTANLVEVVWTTVALVGLTFGVTGVVWARNDKNALRDTPISSLLHIIADENLRVEWSRVWALVFCLIAGVDALLYEDPPQPDPQYAVSGLISAVCFLAIEIIVFTSAAKALNFKRVFWRRLTEMEASEREAAIRGGRRRDDQERRLGDRPRVAYAEDEIA